MIEFILLIVLLLGIVLMCVPEHKLKKVNTPMLGLSLIAIVFDAITVIGVYHFGVRLFEFIKGWL